MTPVDSRVEHVLPKGAGVYTVGTLDTQALLAVAFLVLLEAEDPFHISGDGPPCCRPRKESFLEVVYRKWGTQRQDQQVSARRPGRAAKQCVLCGIGLLPTVSALWAGASPHAVQVGFEASVAGQRLREVERHFPIRPRVPAVDVRQ